MSTNTASTKGGDSSTDKKSMFDKIEDFVKDHKMAVIAVILLIIGAIVYIKFGDDIKKQMSGNEHRQVPSAPSASLEAPLKGGAVFQKDY